MATFCLTGLSVAKDRSAVMMVQPADGPSLGVAPCYQQIKYRRCYSFYSLTVILGFRSPETVMKRWLKISYKKISSRDSPPVTWRNRTWQLSEHDQRKQSATTNQIMFVKQGLRGSVTRDRKTATTQSECIVTHLWNMKMDGSPSEKVVLWIFLG